jgi:hypothetical protein
MYVERYWSEWVINSITNEWTLYITKQININVENEQT